MADGSGDWYKASWNNSPSTSIVAPGGFHCRDQDGADSMATVGMGIDLTHTGASNSMLESSHETQAVGTVVAVGSSHA